MKTIAQQRTQCGWTPSQAAQVCECSLEVWNAFEGDSVRPWAMLGHAWEVAYKQRWFDMYGWIDGSDPRPRGF